MLIVDTIKLTLENGSVVGAPTSRASYGASLLPDQSIIYIGKLLVITILFIIYLYFKTYTVYDLLGEYQGTLDQVRFIIYFSDKRVNLCFVFKLVFYKKIFFNY